MKLNFSRFIRVMTMGLTRCYKTEVFSTLISSQSHRPIMPLPPMSKLMVIIGVSYRCGHIRGLPYPYLSIRPICKGIIAYGFGLMWDCGSHTSQSNVTQLRRLMSSGRLRSKSTTWRKVDFTRRGKNRHKLKSASKQLE